MADKLKIVLSDLHLNAGFQAEGNLLESFTADAAFVKLLKEVQQESDREQKEVELILNGDFFDFFLVPAVDAFKPGQIYPVDAYLDSSVEASIKRLKLIAAGHPQVFEALTDFMHVENPLRRITIIKGNHDINLYWPDLKAKVRELLGATGTRSSLLLFAEEFINRENIYIEHGHQHTERLNVYPNFRVPINKADPTQLYYPPGAHFLINCLNQQPGERWWFNHIRPLTSLIWYALKWDFDFAAQTLVQLVQEMPELLTNGIKLNDQSIEQLVQQLEDQTERVRLANKYAATEPFRTELHRLIRYLTCEASVADEYSRQLGPEISSDPLVLAQAEQDAIQNSLKRYAAELENQGKAEVFIFGHTHQPAFEETAHGGYFINTGCWHWNQYLASISVSAWESCLKHRQRMAQSPQFPYARIDYDGSSRPHPQLIDYSGQKFIWETENHRS